MTAATTAATAHAPAAASTGVVHDGVPLDWQGQLTVISPWRAVAWPVLSAPVPSLVALAVWLTGHNPTHMIATGTGLAVVVCGIDRWVTRHNRWRVSPRVGRGRRRTDQERARDLL